MSAVNSNPAEAALLLAQRTQLSQFAIKRQQRKHNALPTLLLRVRRYTVVHPAREQSLFQQISVGMTPTRVCFKFT